MIGIEQVPAYTVAPVWAAIAVCASLASIVAAFILFLGENAPKRRTWAMSHKAHSIVAFLFVTVATYYGGGKSRFYFDTDTLVNSGSAATNDTVLVSWSLISGVLGTDTVYIDYRPNSSTNDSDWIVLGTALAMDGCFGSTLAGATNYDFWVYCEYVPPTPVVTNGVYQLSVQEPTSNRIITIGSEIRVNGAVIAPPKKENQQ